MVSAPSRLSGTSGAWSPRTTLAKSALTGALAIAGVASASVAQSASSAGSLVFDEATVVDVEQGQLIPHQRVVVAGNRIQAVGDAGSVKVPKGAQVVAANGKYLIPGLWDMHVHTHTDRSFPLLIANGVTGVRDAWSFIPMDTLRRWRQEVLAGTRVGPPRQILSAVGLSDRDPCTPWKTGWIGHVCVTPADASQVVDALKAAGVDMLKMYNLGADIYFAIAREARRVGLPFGGHLRPEIPAEVAADSGAAIIDHPFAFLACFPRDAKFDAARCKETLARLRQNGTWVALTAMAVSGLNGSDAENVKLRLSERMQEYWAGTLPTGNWLRDSVRPTPDSSATMGFVQRAGMPLLAGTDVNDTDRDKPFGFALHAELAIYVADGMTPLDALRTGTLNPAKVLHATDSLGTVAAGKLADLVLLDANPLDDITNTTAIRAVVANGRYFDRAALDRLLVEGRAETPPTTSWSAQPGDTAVTRSTAGAP